MRVFLLSLIFCSAISFALDAKEAVQLANRIEVRKQENILKFFYCHLDKCVSIGKSSGYAKDDLVKKFSAQDHKQDSITQIIWDGIESKSFVIVSNFKSPVSYERDTYSIFRCSDNAKISEFIKSAQKSQNESDYLYPMESHRKEICAGINHPNNLGEFRSKLSAELK